MKILLDECVPKKLKSCLRDFEVRSVTEMGWSGVKNGRLLALCVEYKFDLLLTIDKNLVHQQNIDKYKISIAVLDCVTSKIDELKLFIPSLLSKFAEMEYHKVYLIAR